LRKKDFVTNLIINQLKLETMNCTNCGTPRQTKTVLTSCEMTGALITVNMGYCPCKDKDDDDLSGRMIDRGERPTINVDPRDASPGLLRKVNELKKLQRVSKFIGIDSSVEIRETIPNRSERGWFI